MNVKRLLACLCCSFLLVPLLCSWVDPTTVDVYTAQINKTDFTYSTANLSGNIDYFVSGYNGFCLSENGILWNTSNTARTGYMLTANGAQYECRFPAGGGFQIYQSYVSNNMTRWVWVSYDLTPDEVPSVYGLLEYSLILIAAIVIILVAVIIIGRGVIL